MEIQLGAASRRILGVLVEKEMTTPNQYPLSINALTNGCNQKSNRFPPMSLDDYEVEDRLKTLVREGWVNRVDQEGARVSKWSHRVGERLGVSRPDLAVLAELLLRGAQQPGELRTRASRMHPFPSPESLENVLSGLVEKGYARLLSRQSGERVARFDHAFYAEGEEPVAEEVPAAAPPLAAPPTRSLLEERVSRLEKEVEDLRTRLARLEGPDATMGSP